jgi:hypothetical protein
MWVQPYRSRYQSRWGYATWWQRCESLGCNKHLLTCLACQQNKRQIHGNKNPILQHPVPFPMTRFHMEFHGPFVESCEKKFILVTIDSTSMRTELLAVENCDAQTVIDAFYDNIICRFGIEPD